MHTRSWWTAEVGLHPLFERRGVYLTHQHQSELFVYLLGAFSPLLMFWSVRGLRVAGIHGSEHAIYLGANPNVFLGFHHVSICRHNQIDIMLQTSNVPSGWEVSCYYCPWYPSHSCPTCPPHILAYISRAFKGCLKPRTRISRTPTLPNHHKNPNRNALQNMLEINTHSR